MLNFKYFKTMPACTCPAAASIGSVPNLTCAQDFGQIQKIIFQRVFSSGATKNKLTFADSKLLASWTALFSAADGTKTVITPYVEAPTPEGGDAITFGGGNDTIGGITKVIGRNPVSMTFAARQYPQDIISALKTLQCEPALGVYLVNGDGQIMGLVDSASSPTEFYPIPISSLFVGDLMPNGLDNPDANSIRFSFFPNWSDKAYVVTPTDFNAVTDLVNTSA